MATIDPQALRTFRNSLTGHALTTSEKADALQILSECADEIERLRRVEAAARDYYMRYAQDEADDDGREVTGCCETQHLHAQALRDALSPNAEAELPPPPEASDGSERDRRSTPATCYAAEDTHWEHGYRTHGLWTDAQERLAAVSLGPRGLWDGLYRWRIDSSGEHGEKKTLRAAKRAVENCLRYNPSATGTTRGGRHENNRHPLPRM